MKKAEDAKKGEATPALAQAGKQETDVKHDIEHAQDQLSRTPPADQLAAEAAPPRQGTQQDRADTSRIPGRRRQSGAGIEASNALPEGGTRSGWRRRRRRTRPNSTPTRRNFRSSCSRLPRPAAERGDQKQAQALKAAADAT